MSLGGGALSPEERAYLELLPAVKHVTQTRIIYEEAFKRECVRRYYAGARPVAMFREAGLDPDLIGYKRIERCIARWKRAYGPEIQSAGDAAEDGTAMSLSEALTKPDMFAMRNMGRVRGKKDYRDMLIYQQVRQINRLELRIKELETQLSEFKNTVGGGVEV